MAGVVLATAGYDHTIRFWEAASGTCNRTVKYADSQVNCMQITPEKKYIAAAGNPHIRLFEINSNNPNHVTSYDGHSSNVTSVGFQKHGKWMFSSSDDGTVKIWDLRAPSCQRTIECNVPVNAVALHPNQSELLIADQNGGLRLHDLTSNSTSFKYAPGGETDIRSVAFVPDASAFVAGNNDGTVFVYRPSSSSGYELQTSIQAHDTYILKTKISADGKYLATCSSDKTAKIWNLEDKSSYELLHTLQGHQRWVWDCSFSAVSSYLVTCSSDQTARLWDLSQGETIRHYNGHHKAVICVALNDSVVE